MKKRKRGRPKGSKTRDLTICEAAASRCPKCDSTERTPYGQHGQTEVVWMSKVVEEGGIRFNCVVYRVTICLSCGHPRKDKTRELSKSVEETQEASGHTTLDTARVRVSGNTLLRIED